VTLGLQLRAVEDSVPDDRPEIASGLASVEQGLTGAADDLREDIRGVFIPRSCREEDLPPRSGPSRDAAQYRWSWTSRKASRCRNV